jgi:fatty-acyl-CoA synthase
MSANPYTIGLDKNAANYAPLSPLSFIERTATVYPQRTASSTAPAASPGPRPTTAADAWRPPWRRTAWQGDTVAAMLSNTPEMLECHFGVPMAGAVLNTLNTRLDAEAIAFMLGTARPRR